MHTRGGSGGALLASRLLIGLPPRRGGRVRREQLEREVFRVFRVFRGISHY